jgi:hypothetical protein
LGAALQADGETRSRFRGLKHQKEKRSMDHFAGLDVSVKETSVCIVDDAGKEAANCLFGQLQKRGWKNAGENTTRIDQCDEVAGTVP